MRTVYEAAGGFDGLLKLARAWHKSDKFETLKYFSSFWHLSLEVTHEKLSQT